MSSLALMEVQHALYTKLKSDSVLMGMLSGLYDIVPQKTIVPYVMIGDGTQQNEMADGVNISECRLELHVWTETSGRKTALAILNRLYGLIHLGSLTLSGFQLLTLRVEHASTILVEQGNYLSGTLGVLVTVVEE